MKSVVITGSTRGLGYGMAQAFLVRSCSVMISGRKPERVEAARAELIRLHPRATVAGHPCDVREFDQVQRLWNAATTELGRVDIWINNAGFSAAQGAISSIPPDQAKQAIETNLLGVIYGSQVACTGMLDQGGGSLYNMEGLGSDGRMHEGLILYGTGKYGASYFVRGLVRETAGSAVIVGSLRPGMVITDLITEQYADRPQDWERAKRVFNIIADRVETVAPWLVDRILENRRHGAQITRVSRVGLLFRFLRAPFTRRDLFREE